MQAAAVSWVGRKNAGREISTHTVATAVKEKEGSSRPEGQEEEEEEVEEKTFPKRRGKEELL